MNKQATLLLVLIGMAAFSCEDNPPITTDTKEATLADTVRIGIDLEDHMYRYDDKWYRWDVEVEDCAPQFAVAYSWDTSILTISHCSALGEIEAESIHLDNEYCFENPPILEAVEMADGLTLVHIEVSPEFRDCLIREIDWINLQFEFLFE